MPTYKPITPTSPLPAVGVAVEHDVLDFKELYRPQDPKCRYEMAKDMAMFANHLGGTLLVGAVEDSATRRLQRYAPLAEADAAAISQAFEEAERHCFPKPVVSIERIPHESRWLLAVNVDPVIGTAVGVRHHQSQDAYLFPLRRTSQCIFLTPEVLPMFMLPDLRRKVILLSQIPENHRVNIVFDERSSNVKICHFIKVVPERNCFLVRDDNHPRHVSLDHVVTVWPHDDHVTFISLNSTRFLQS